jgi:hypothetical protein
MALMDYVTYWLSRPLCRLGWYSLSCRGRTDHDPYKGHWTSRW